MSNPYSELPATAFWKTAVADREMLEISDLWTPKFPIHKNNQVATFGSCFAQHFGRRLRERHFKWMDGEPAPEAFGDEDKRKFGYQLFSARTGNIYTTSLLKQWVSWAVGERMPPEEVWEKDGRFYDPFRPTIEPGGFATAGEVVRSRDVTIDALRSLIENTDLFVFTLGLTESWFNARQNYEYPLCPGTAAGDFDPKIHRFEAQSFETVNKNLQDAMAMIHAANDQARFLLTVSPVPLTATNTGKHVLVATSASKAILRAVAETAATDYQFVDYFPSYEIINSPPFKGAFFKPNLRSVSDDGVDFVMGSFFKAIGAEDMADEPIKDEPPVKLNKARAAVLARKEELDALICEEELLAAFGPDGHGDE